MLSSLLLVGAIELESSQAAVFEIGQTGDWPGMERIDGSTAYGVRVSGTRAFIADSLGGLQIVEVSDLAHPVHLGAYPPPVGPEAFLCLDVSGTNAFVGTSAGRLRIVNIVNSSAPALVGTYSTFDSINGVFLSGTNAYLAVGGLGLQVVGVANPASPALSGLANTTGTARGVWVAGNRAYLASDSAGLEVVDVANPASPTKLKTFTTAGPARAVQVVGTYAYLAAGFAGLQIVDVANPADPVLAGSISVGGFAYGVFVSGRYAAVAAGNSGLAIVDVGSPSSPAMVGTHDTAGTALGVCVQGDGTFVADGAWGLVITAFPEPPAFLSPERVGPDLVFTWTGFPATRLQRGTTLTSQNWSDVTNSVGFSGVVISRDRTNGFFRLVAAAPPAPVFNPPVYRGEHLVISWSDNASSRLQFSPVVTGAAWVDIAPTNGMRGILVPTQAAQEFFRLALP